jgi:hypothetical protein
MPISSMQPVPPKMRIASRPERTALSLTASFEIAIACVASLPWSLSQHDR